MWFRDDLRLADNPALCAAATGGRPVAVVFVFDEESVHVRPIGGAARWWLHCSLTALCADLEKHNVKLLLRRGKAGEIIPELAADLGVEAVYWNRRYDATGRAIDASVKKLLRERGLVAESFNGALLYEPWEVRNGDGQEYRVFSPFWRAARRVREPQEPLDVPEIRSLDLGKVRSDVLEDWRLLPKKPDWSGGLQETWVPGETGARDRLAVFLRNGLARYKSERDRPAAGATSMLSPHLRHGEISPRQVWFAACHARDAGKAGAAATEKFLAELGWREFSYSLLFNHADLGQENFQKKFNAFPWRENRDGLRRWQRGQTGYPFVDAGMRELWRTGTMHNRVRMVVASFLVKHLLIHWRDGEAWFWDTLVDADPANNAASWQWVAGSGADAAPYFRIFNPIAQGEKFDLPGVGI